jgi:hypothetical protein
MKRIFAMSHYERSTVQFTYHSLDQAVSVAKAVNALDANGAGCSIQLLADRMEISLPSLRSVAASASAFGLTKNACGEVRLTSLGRRIVDPSQEADARIEAFLEVPLYARVFETYKCSPLPGPIELEKFIRDVGVPGTQARKARQKFINSAWQAGFLAHFGRHMERTSNAL